MTRYCRSDDNITVDEYPYTFAKLRKDNPDVSYPRGLSDERLAEFGVRAVAEVARPAYDPNFNIVEGTPVKVDGQWTQVWNQEPATAEQIAERTKAAADAADKESVRVDSFVQNFVGMTPAQVSAYIDANVTNLASAKSVIDKLALMVLVLAKREFD